MSRKLFSPKLTAFCGIFGQLFIFVLIFLAISVSPWFTWTGYALSNLGDLTRVSAPLFNGALIIGGTILVFFVLGFGMKAKTHVLGIVGTILLFAEAVGVIGVGIFPMNYLLPHAISALTIFLSNSIALFVFGLAFVLRKPTRPFSFISFALCIVATFVWFIPWGTGIAIPEFIAVFAMYVWIVIMSARLIIGKEIIPKK
jgi:hypothetical membrane protein